MKEQFEKLFNPKTKDNKTASLKKPEFKPAQIVKRVLITMKDAAKDAYDGYRFPIN